jgi:hypothetical protein
MADQFVLIEAVIEQIATMPGMPAAALRGARGCVERAEGYTGSGRVNAHQRAPC